MPLRWLRLDAVLAPDTRMAETDTLPTFIASKVCQAIDGFVFEGVVEHPRLKSGSRPLGSPFGVSGIHDSRLLKKATEPARNEVRVAHSVRTMLPRESPYSRINQLRASYVRRTTSSRVSAATSPSSTYFAGAEIC